VKKRFIILIFAGVFSACGLENPIFNAITHDKSTRLPDVQDNVIHGIVTNGNNAKINAFVGGNVLKAVSATADAKGEFRLHLPGVDTFKGLVVSATSLTGQYLNLVPNVPAQASVFNGEAKLPLNRLNPACPVIDINSTATALLIQGRLLLEKKSMNSLSVHAIAQAQADLMSMSKSNMDVKAFFDFVAGLIKKSPGSQIFVSDLPEKAEIGDLLSADIDQTTRQDFVKMLKAAATSFKFQVCYSRTQIAVVFMLDMSAGKKDGNCQAVDTFAWAKDKPGKHVYITGGVHKTTPICDDQRKTACLTQTQADQANKLLGNWVPNQIRMYDDGTHGDIAANDSIYTISFNLPYIPISDSPDGRGVRLGYKYTYGHPGQGWTGSEEWPGNQRIIELEDVNGDGIVTRYDIFGDETSDKDKANQLTPANGGCGVNLWETDKRDACGHDTWENRIDTNGDCKPDTWPNPGNVSAITVPCK